MLIDRVLSMASLIKINCAKFIRCLHFFLCIHRYGICEYYLYSNSLQLSSNTRKEVTEFIEIICISFGGHSF